jgi:hypothetical protein
MSSPKTLPEICDRMRSDMCGRRSIVAIEFDTLADVLAGRVAVENFPKDGVIVGIQQISMFQVAEIVVESADFPKLNPGEMIPRGHMLLRRLDANHCGVCKAPLTNGVCTSSDPHTRQF